MTLTVTYGDVNDNDDLWWLMVTLMIMMTYGDINDNDDLMVTLMIMMTYDDLWWH